MKDKIKILFVSGNENKVREVQHILGDEFIVNNCKIDLPELQFVDVKDVIKSKIISAYEMIQTPDISAKIINAFTEKGITINKDLSDINIICEDSGLHILGNGMNGFPGALIKFYYELLGNPEIIKRDAGAKAKAVCAIGLIKDGKVYQGDITGELHGHIANKYKEVEGSFGWGTAFVPDLSDTSLSHIQGKTLAEFTKEEKSKVSQRVRAFHKLINILIPQVQVKRTYKKSSKKSSKKLSKKKSSKK